uniref:Hesp-c55 n=1 Tax=Melampsora lini TaxID=5261 RepID=Q2MV30_MELLI|nr:hesp-c55 [Melampsora lini]
MQFRVIPLYNISFFILALLITRIGCPNLPQQASKWWYTASTNLKLSPRVYIKDFSPDTHSMIVRNTENTPQMVHFWVKGNEPEKNVVKIPLAPGASKNILIPKGTIFVGSELNPKEYHPKEE